jgi:hypothetical protein
MPMAPTLVRESFHRDGWVYEGKVDGWRMLAYKDGQRVRLVSRNGVDHTRRFADIAAAVSKAASVPLRVAARARLDRRRHAAAPDGVRHSVLRRPRRLRAAAT